MSAAAARCPYCGEEQLARVGRCPRCDGDLAPLHRVAELADRSFNAGLDAAGRREWAAARECLAVAVALDPSDTGAAVLLGKLRFQHGDRDLAIETWSGVLRIDPDHAGALAAIEYARTA